MTKPNLVTGLLFVFILISFFQARTINSLREDVKAANQRADEASSEAFKDCQRIMAAQDYMTRINTCYQVVTTMCAGQSKCVDHYKQMCVTEDYE